ncbi:MAG: aromatic amino acid transaminase [Paracoccaceae bacterium]
MFDSLSPVSEDKILRLMALFREDTREQKIDLGVGVYRNAAGQTPVMRAVRAAGLRLAQTETTKSYTALAGDPAFSASMMSLILGEGTDAQRIAAVATPGGTGAFRIGLELVRLATPGARIWLPEPSWPNHASIAGYLGLPVMPYRYYDAPSGGVDFGGLLTDLAGAQAGDVVVLHGCCHNPTGANLTLPEWAEVAQVLERTGALPFVDLAYQGFGDGLEADAAPTRLLASRLPEMLIAASCSKNFGIYRERAGLLMALAGGAAGRGRVQDSMTWLNRQNYSFPPDHGARLVTTILTDADLRDDWQAELDDIRNGMLDLRMLLARELQRVAGSDRFGFVAQHRGMFSRLSLTPEQVEALRRDHAIYIVGDGRINIAGLNAATVPILARAVIAVGG